MAAVTIDDATNQLLAVLREAFGGTERWSYFIDHGSDSGLLGTLARLSAAEASRTINGSSIAAHVHHLVFSLAASTAWVSGDRTPRNWDESWRLRTVDEASWPELVSRLRTGYEELRQALQAHAASSVEAFGGGMGAVAHVAYHLGAIRQKVAAVRLT